MSDHHHKMFGKKSLHRRNDSEEIDVFQAAKYYSCTNEKYPESDTTRIGIKDGQSSISRPSGHAGISLEVSSMGKATQPVRVVKGHQSKEKRHKQPPTSPGGGGRIAKILNAIFYQTSLKKGKPKTTSWSSKSVKAEEEATNCKAPSRLENQSIFGKVRYTSTGDWRRKRRSSISNFEFKIQPEHNSTLSFNSGFRTPPAYPHTPKASSSFKDFRSYSEHKDISPYTFKTHLNHNPQLSFISKDPFSERPLSPEVDEEEESEFTKFSDADAGADSDSSSDLFDLPNCDHNIYSGELPVYESTHIEGIQTTT